MPSSSSSHLLKSNTFHQLQTSATKPWKTNLSHPLLHRIDFNPPPPPPPYHTSDQTTLTSLISSIKTHTTNLNLSLAFDAYSTLLHHSPSNHHHFTPIASLLLCSSTLKSLPHGQQLHAHVLSLGFIPKNPPFMAKLVTLYAACDRLSEARSVAKESAAEHPLPWNVLLSAYVRNESWSEVVRVYEGMVAMGVRCDAFTFPSVLKACGELGKVGLELGRQIHREVGRGELGRDLFVRNALLSMYAKCGEIDLARETFDEMPERDRVSWNAMISGYSSREMWEEAIGVFEKMRSEDVEVNAVTWNTIAGGRLQMGGCVEALQLISEVIRSGFGVDHVSFVIGLRACSQMGSVRIGKAIHGMTLRACCSQTETVRNGLITMYSRCDNMSSARVVFDMAQEQTLVTWNCMITGYCILDQSEEALSVFRGMLWSGICPNYVTVVTILALCARIANLQHGKELHCYITKHGLKEHRVILNSLVDMYSKTGRIKEARMVFDTITDRDEVLYTSLIAGYGMQGEGQMALALFDEMIKHEINPDHVTIVAVLSACCHARLVVQGQKLFDTMTRSYNVNPQMEHYSCMVDLYARSGMLDKAEDFLNEMTLKPIAPMWASLLGACLVYRNTEIGERAAKKLLEMKPNNPGHYVLIANMYAAAGSWRELAKVRILMRDMGIKKVPGCAWLDLGNVLYPFLVGDRENPDSTHIYRLLDELSEQLKDAGYVGNEQFQFDEELNWQDE